MTVDTLELHRPVLVAHCRRMLGSSCAAEDAVQETLLRAWRGAGRFEGRAQPRTWLLRIATNVCLDELTAARPAAVPVAPEDVDDLAAVPDERAGAGAPPHGADPCDVLLHREAVRLAVAVLLDRLPARQRAALLLCGVLRQPAREAAALLGVSVVSVNSALQRARATLAEADVRADAVAPALDAGPHALLTRYAAAFERCDVEALVALALEEGGAAVDRAAA